MRILLVDDDRVMVEGATNRLRRGGLEFDGIVASHNMETHDGQELSEEDVLSLVHRADVIFLDDNMPGKSGEVLLTHWKDKGIDFSTKRVVGISFGHQPYLHESFSKDGFSTEIVKRFLGLG